MTKKNASQGRLTTAAEAIGATLGALTVKAGLAHPAKKEAVKRAELIGVKKSKAAPAKSRTAKTPAKRKAIGAMKKAKG